MVLVGIHFTQGELRAQFESDYAFTKWLGYLKDHGLANARLADSGRSVIVFKHAITYLSLEDGMTIGSP